MQRIKIYSNNIPEIFAALENKIEKRNWKITNIRMVSSGFIALNCEDEFTLILIRCLIECITDENYQIVYC